MGCLWTLDAGGWLGRFGGLAGTILPRRREVWWVIHEVGFGWF